MIRLADLLSRARAAAEDLQQERITIHGADTGGFDWDTGSSSSSTGSALYSDPARVKPVARSRGEEVNAGEANVTLREYVISVPWSTPAPAERIVPGAVIDVDASPDTRMVGLRLWVTGVEYSATATAWRISAEDRS